MLDSLFERFVIIIRLEVLCYYETDVLMEMILSGGMLMKVV